MSELSGTLDGVGLAAILRFLTGLNKTGCLGVAHGDWRGEVFFEGGRVIGASLGSCTGLPALDALVQALPTGTFEFDSSWRPDTGSTIHMSREDLALRLDELESAGARSRPRLPSMDLVPALVAEDGTVGGHEGAPGGEEALALDRGTLQTLLAVDGRRSVRAIVAERGSLDALWQLGHLMEVGLVRSTSPAAAPEVTPAAAPDESPSPVTGVRRLARAAEAAVGQVSPRACPKLGFEDDPSTSFGRPTRLHRCFAAGRPLPVSMDQQRELCMDERFATCPRLAAAGAEPSPASAAAASADAPAATSEDARIVRWPYAGRARMAARVASASGEGASASAARGSARFDRPSVAAGRGSGEVDRPSGGGRGWPGAERASAGEAATAAGSETARVRQPSAASRDGVVARPMPLRSRIERPTASPSAVAVLERQPAPSAAPASDSAEAEPRPGPQPANHQTSPPPGQRHRPTGARLLRGVPPLAIGAAVAVVVALAAIGYLLAPRLAPLLADDALDPTRLPNTSAVVAGTPLAQVAASRPRAAVGDVAQRAPAVSPSGAAATAVAVSQPTPQAQAGGAQGPTAALLDEQFTAGTVTWPDDPQSTAWLAGGSYQVATRRPGEFVAISAPIAQVPSDVIVRATVRKIGGPPGGGFGIIMRDQGPDAQDGLRQAGRYYVLEVGDRGEVGMWRRETDHWVDLLPWQPSNAVKPGLASNELTVRAIGDSLSLMVNGVQVATRNDAAYSSGRVGLFVGGDGNQVAVERFVVQTP